MDKKVCLDPGHGGYDPGAVGPTGVKEKDITLAVCLKVAKYLRPAGIDVVFTRSSDNVPWPANLSQDLLKRCQIANNSGADIFVSVHCNSATNSTAKGNEIYTTPGQDSADDLANCIQSRVKVAFPDLVYREDWVDGDIDKEANFYVMKHTNMPAVLTEMAFISNLAEEKMLANTAIQSRMALAIAQGIGDYLGIPVGANYPIIQIGDKTIEGVIIDNRTYAPVRAFGEALGLPVVWDPKKGVTVGGVKIDVLVIDGTSYAPVRYLAEALGKTVTWDGEKVVIA